VGVEVVGEILEQYPSKQVTIVHPAETLMDGWPKSAIKKMNKFLNGKGKRVQVILGKKVSRSEGTRHELSDGTFIEGTTSIPFAVNFFLYLDSHYSGFENHGNRSRTKLRITKNLFWNSTLTRWIRESSPIASTRRFRKHFCFW
jgi:hypothetical protein